MVAGEAGSSKITLPGALNFLHEADRMAPMGRPVASLLVDVCGEDGVVVVVLAWLLPGTGRVTAGLRGGLPSVGPPVA